MIGCPCGCHGNGCQAESPTAASGCDREPIVWRGVIMVLALRATAPVQPSGAELGALDAGGTRLSSNSYNVLRSCEES